MNDIPTIAANLHTQDNRITANPIFLVQQLVRDYGYDPEYAYDDGHITWIDQDGEVDADERTRLNEEYDKTLEEPDGYTRTGFVDRWQFVQPFFTERGAQEYIRVNSHNLREPRIYVESGWRNTEWEIVRAHLMGLKP